MLDGQCLDKFPVIIDRSFPLMSLPEIDFALPADLYVGDNDLVAPMYQNVRLEQCSIHVPDMGLLLDIPPFRFTIVGYLFSYFVVSLYSRPVRGRACLQDVA